MHIFTKMAVAILSLTFLWVELSIAGDGSGKEDQLKRKHMTFFKKADTNGDHRVSKEEFLAQVSKQFEKMDRNHDGYLDNEDRQKRKKNIPSSEK